jgi:hypothetical protein
VDGVLTAWMCAANRLIISAMRDTCTQRRVLSKPSLRLLRMHARDPFAIVAILDGDVVPVSFVRMLDSRHSRTGRLARDTGEAIPTGSLHPLTICQGMNVMTSKHLPVSSIACQILPGRRAFPAPIIWPCVGTPSVRHASPATFRSAVPCPMRPGYQLRSRARSGGSSTGTSFLGRPPCTKEASLPRPNPLAANSAPVMLSTSANGQEQERCGSGRAAPRRGETIRSHDEPAQIRLRHEWPLPVFGSRPSFRTDGPPRLALHHSGPCPSRS